MKIWPNSNICPTCGSKPDTDFDHTDDCERVDTCGQFGPPWHVELHPQDPLLPSLLELQINDPTLTRRTWEDDYSKPWGIGLRQHLMDVIHTAVTEDE